MPDLRERFRALDSLEVPDVMTRVDEMGPSLPTPEPIPIGRRVGTIAFAAAITAVAILLATRVLPREAPRPAEPVPPTGVDENAFVDIGTGEATPLPDSLTDFAGGAKGYEVSPDGTMVLFDAAVGVTEPHQIYVANLDGTRVRKITDEPAGAVDGSWSPDGSEIVYAAGWNEPPPDLTLSIVEVSSGRSRSVVRGLSSLQDQFRAYPVPRFSPDGMTILFTDDRGLNTVPVTGGKSTAFPVSAAAWGTYSPDGAKIAFLDTAGFSYAGHGPTLQEIWIADADGDRAHVLVPYQREVDPNWSPDGTRIVYTHVRYALDHEIIVFDVATRGQTTIAAGDAATWLDDETLIVEGYRGSEEASETLPPDPR